MNKPWKVLFLCLAALGLSGCTSITRYSIESYQGPLLLDEKGFVAAPAPAEPAAKPSE